MMYSIRTLLFFALLASVVAEYAMEGEEYSLRCETTDPVQYWMLHGKGVAYNTGTTYEEVNIKVDDTGVLHFMEVKKEHAGDHVCVTSASGVIRGIPTTMQVRPLPSQNLWQDMYRAQFITGLVAALVCAFIFASGCLVFRYRWRAPERYNGLAEAGGHCNPALEIDAEPNSSNHTKM